MFLTFIHLPGDIKYQPLQWNTTTHGNITFIVFLHVSRWAIPTWTFHVLFVSRLLLIGGDIISKGSAGSSGSGGRDITLARVKHPRLKMEALPRQSNSASITARARSWRDKNMLICLRIATSGMSFALSWSLRYRTNRVFAHKLHTNLQFTLSINQAVTQI